MTRQINIEERTLVEVQRRKFEQHARTHIQFANLERKPTGEYARKSMQDCWVCWVTALRLNV